MSPIVSVPVNRKRKIDMALPEFTMRQLLEAGVDPNFGTTELVLGR